ncbi:MAG: MFS transporter [Pseudomonadota bacterium]
MSAVSASMQTGYLAFIRDNAPFLGVGALLALLSSFGQTFFISIFGGEIRSAFSLSNGDWGVTYMIGTLASAALMVFAGGLADQFRVRTLGIAVVVCLGLSCLAMAFNGSVAILIGIIFLLRFFGQGMSMHMATVAMSRWFVASRGRALAVSGMGFMIGEMTLPLIMVWLKSIVDWRVLWVCFGVVCFAMAVVLFRLLRLERTPQAEAEENSSTGMRGRHWTRGDALRNPMFWLIMPGVIFFSAFGTAFWFHQVHFAEVKGWSHLALVAVFPLGTATLMAATIAYGWAIDRFGAVSLLPFYVIPYILAFVLHWYAPSLMWIGLGVMLMGAGQAGNGTIINACWAEFYGTNHIGAIKAAATAAMVFGSAIGPGISGILIDYGVGIEIQMLGFAACFTVSAVLMAVAARMFQHSTTAA